MTLTQAATITRRGVILFIALIILSITGKIGYEFYRQYQIANTPPVEEVAEARFGKLPVIEFPASVVKSDTYTYAVDTVTGALPNFPKLIKVYFIPRAGLSLLAPEKSRQLAESLGFSVGPETLSETQYKFTDNQGGELTIDITTGNFAFKRAVASQSAEIRLDSQDIILNQFRSYLNSKVSLPEDLAGGKSNVQFDGGTQEQAISATVSIWPSDIDELPIIASSFNEGLVKATVVPAVEEKDQYPEVTYIHWPIDTSTYSTYELKTSQEAFEDLKEGRGYIALTPTSSQISLTSVYLGYYQSAKYTPYMQPVYIFEGPSFVAIVPALR